MAAGDAWPYQKGAWQHNPTEQAGAWAAGQTAVCKFHDLGGWWDSATLHLQAQGNTWSLARCGLHMIGMDRQVRV